MALRRPVALVPVLAIVAAGMAFALLRQAIGHADYLVDLRAFYCGGSSLLHHDDPYTTLTVACTHALSPGSAPLRAPHPPFALFFYSLMAMLPFKTVGYAYIVTAWCAVGATSLLLARIAKIDAWIAALGCSTLLGYYCITFGQPTPFVALFIVLAAYLVVTDRPAVAAVPAALTLVFPQVGLPLVVAMFVCLPRARVAVAGAVAFLALFGLVVVGPAANVHYLTVSLKLEQLQTAGDSLQYSVPWLLQQFHFPAFFAALAGSIWYVLLVAATIVWLARNSTKATRALVLLLPPAVVPLASSFVHPQHFALALPAALYVLGANPVRLGPVLLGTALLAMPWPFAIVTRSLVHDGARTAVFVLIGIAFAACFVRFDTDVRTRPALRAWIAVTAVAFVLIVLAIHVALGHIPSVDTPPNSLRTLSFKLPSVAAVLIVAISGLANGRREPSPYA